VADVAHGFVATRASARSCVASSGFGVEESDRCGARHRGPESDVDELRLAHRFDPGGGPCKNENGVLQKDGRLAVTGAMAGANGVVATVKTVWQWNKDEKVWDLITAVPAR